MSKEQTPITAEELIRNSDLWLKERGQFEGVIEIMEQYANAKVLEALENCCGMSREQAVHARKRMKQK
jgi:3-isopropylmalate dehydratase small subunit